MVPEYLGGEVAQILERLRAGETIFNLETQRMRKDGHIISVVVTTSPVRDVFGTTVGLAGISKDISEKKQLEAEIARQRQSLAVLEERERIAREMHDGLAQVLGYVNTKAQAVRRFLAIGKTEQAQAHLLQLEEAALEVYADVREAILGLRTAVSSEKGLAQTLQEYLKSFEQQSGIRTRLIITDEDASDRFAPHVEVQLVRIIQESLTNVRKHANAQYTTVRLERTNNHARITIEDDGRGFELAQSQRDGQPHFGLQTRRERAEGVGGTLDVESSPNNGARVCVIFPLDSTEEQI
jgi:signal transduction histidine kinase